VACSYQPVNNLKTSHIHISHHHLFPCKSMNHFGLGLLKAKSQELTTSLKSRISRKSFRLTQTLAQLLWNQSAPPQNGGRGTPLGG
jgi:hypothetical protein